MTWKSDEHLFNYDSDMSISATAKAFAKEPWNKQYFDDLKKWIYFPLLSLTKKEK